MLLVSTVSLMAANMGKSNIYAGGGLAYESPEHGDSGVALVLNGGMVLPDVDVGPGKLGVDGEFTYSVLSHSYGCCGYDYDITFMSLGAYAIYIYDINREYYVKPRIGLAYNSVDVSGPGNYNYGSDSEIDLAFGVSGGYRLSKTMDVYVALNFPDSDWMQLGAGVQMHF